LRLVASGDDLFGGTSVQDYFAKYLEDIEAADELIPAPGLFDFGHDAYGGLVYNEHDNPLFRPLKQMVREASQRALARWLSSQAPTVLARLKADRTDASMLHEAGVADGKYAGMPILHNIPVADFADLTLDDGNLNGRLLGALHERYSQGWENELEPEFDWMITLKAELERRVDASSPPFKEFNKLQVEYFFRDILRRIESARPPTVSPKPASKRARKPRTPKASAETSAARPTRRSQSKS
jgi:hypothetical protein